MDEVKFRDAQEAYGSGDYRTAAKLFLAAAGSGGKGSGPAYHLAGNSLLRLRRYGDAVTVYTHALKDEAYERRTSVCVNLASAQAALGYYAEAVATYEEVLDDPEYRSRHRALHGKAGALFDMGRIDEACVAYRDAALDGGNPDPGGALNNVGLCLMKLGKVDDAIEAYKEALRIDTYAGRGRAAANLGIAYAAVDRHEDAVRAFEQATERFGHKLSKVSGAVYLKSRAELSSEPERETVEGWTTGEITDEAVEAEGAPQESGDDTASVPSAKEEGGEDAETGGAAEIVEPESPFFTRTEEEMRELYRQEKLAERLARRAQGWWRSPWFRWLAPAVALVVLLNTLYFLGYGYPSQGSTVRGMMSARKRGEGVERFWVAVPSADVDKEMAKLPAKFEDAVVDGVDRSRAASTVRMTVTLAEGAPLRYSVTLSREGVGWKVSGVENAWDSTAE